SRAIGAPKRGAPAPAIRRPVHQMCLAMSEVYQYETTPDPRTTERGIAFLGRIFEGELTDEEFDDLLKMRGGCRCSWPNVSAPCHACTDEITDAEAEELLEWHMEQAP
ncbi:MAG: hypothetical protein RLZZ373_422, partial [Pseudomonadota bacterium]